MKTAAYTLADYATQGYVALVGLLILFGHNLTTPRWAALVAGHAVLLVAIHALIAAHARGRGGRLLELLRHFYPVPLFIVFYRETAELNRLLVPQYLDPLLIRLEGALFGGQLSLTLMQRFPYRAVSETLYAAYLSYYFMIPGIGLALYFRDRRHFAHFLAVLSLVFYACYLAYICLPVIGPSVFHQDWRALGIPAEVIPADVPAAPAEVANGFCFGLMRWVYRVFEAPGAAFPSSHVAVAILTLYFSFRYLPRIAWIHLVGVLLLCLATVYCGYHYLLDVAAGLVTAAVLIPVANALHSRFDQTTARS